MRDVRYNIVESACAFKWICDAQSNVEQLCHRSLNESCKHGSN